MNTATEHATTGVIVLGALLALGLLQLRWLLFPPAPDVISEIDKWRRGRERSTDRAGTPQQLSPLGRLTRWVVETLRTLRRTRRAEATENGVVAGQA